MLPANMSDRNISRLSSKQLKEIYGSKGFISWITHRFKSLFITGFNYTLMPFELLFNVLLGIILLPGTPFSAKVRKMCYKRALTTYYDALKRLVSVTSIFSFATYKKYTAKYKWSLYKISRIDL